MNISDMCKKIKLCEFTELYFLTVHRFDLVSVASVDDRSAKFEGVGQFAGLDCKFFRQEGEALDFFEVCKTVLELFDALLKHLLNLGVLNEFVDIAECDLFAASIFL